MIHVLLGTFLVNSLAALVLFDSGVSQSCVSSTISRIFDIPLDALEHPMRIPIAGKDKVPVSNIFHDCTLEFFGVSYPIDLAPIPMGTSTLILGWIG